MVESLLPRAKKADGRGGRRAAGAILSKSGHDFLPRSFAGVADKIALRLLALPAGH